MERRANMKKKQKQANFTKPEILLQLCTYDASLATPASTPMGLSVVGFFFLVPALFIFATLFFFLIFPQVRPRRGESSLPVRAPRRHGLPGGRGGPSLGTAADARGRLAESIHDDFDYIHRCFRASVCFCYVGVPKRRLPS